VRRIVLGYYTHRRKEIGPPGKVEPHAISGIIQIVIIERTANFAPTAAAAFVYGPEQEETPKRNNNYMRVHARGYTEALGHMFGIWTRPCETPTG
jgi:hypothetical protein